MNHSFELSSLMIHENDSYAYRPCECSEQTVTVADHMPYHFKENKQIMTQG